MDELINIHTSEEHDLQDIIIDGDSHEEMERQIAIVMEQQESEEPKLDVRSRLGPMPSAKPSPSFRPHGLSDSEADESESSDNLNTRPTWQQKRRKVSSKSFVNVAHQAKPYSTVWHMPPGTSGTLESHGLAQGCATAGIKRSHPSQQQQHPGLFRYFPKMNRSLLINFVGHLKKLPEEPLDGDIDKHYLNHDLMIFETRNYHKWDQMRKSPFYKDALEEIWTFRLAGFDTEDIPVSMIQLCSISGSTIFFRNVSNLFEEVRVILKESSIRKCASDVKQDVDRLRGLGIEVNGYICTQNIMVSCFPESKQTGTGAQAKIVDVKEIPFNYRNMKYGENIRTLRHDSILHACQDVRVSVAIVLRAGLAVADWENVDARDNILPWVHTLLHSCVDIPRLSNHNARPWNDWKKDSTAKVPWRPGIGRATTTKEGPPIQGLTEFHLLKDFAEISAQFPLFEGMGAMRLPVLLRPPPGKWEDMERLMEQVRFHWSTRGCQLPKNLKNPQNKGPTFNGRCYRCGSPKHIRADCQKRDIRCLYPLCLEPDTHHLCVCPTLHNGCHECKRRGHRLSHHNSFSLPVLEEVFLNFSPGGVYTSVPWFEFEEERAGKLCAQFWYFGLYFRGRENSKKLFRRMGLNYVPLKK